MVVESNEIIGLLNEIFLREGYNLTGVTEKDDLINYGLNSVLAVELVVKLENRFNITIDDEDLSMQNYNTIENIRKLLLKY
jgi:acyl carrier protein